MSFRLPIPGPVAQFARTPAVRLYEHFVIGPTPPVSPDGTPGDPGWCGPGSASWEVFADPCAVIAVFSAMLQQAGSPVIADAFTRFGTYDTDPERRFWLTGGFYFATTYGSCAEAESWIARARHGHRGITGRDVDGREVPAAHGSVMRMSHLSVLDATLRAWEMFGPRRLPVHTQDRFVAEQAWAAARLGIRDVPHTAVQVTDALAEYPEFPTWSASGARSVQSILTGAGLPWQVRGIYAAITAGARAVLPYPHRQTWDLSASAVDVAAGRAFVEAARLGVGELSVVTAAHTRVAAGRAAPRSRLVDGPVALTWPTLMAGSAALERLLSLPGSVAAWQWLAGVWGRNGPLTDGTPPVYAWGVLEEAGVTDAWGHLTVTGAAAAAHLAAHRHGWNYVYRTAQRARTR